MTFIQQFSSTLFKNVNLKVFIFIGYCGGLSFIRAKDVEPELSKNVNTIQKYSDAD
jgi:hypothetical protein